MKPFKRLLVLAIVAGLSLGQLTRITLTPQIAFYVADIFIAIFLIFSFSTLKKILNPEKIKKMWLAKYRRHPILTLAVAILAALAICQTFFSFLATLYLCRFVVYLLFFSVLYQEKILTAAEWRQLISAFFFALAIFGLCQYFFITDPSFLENLGWDDHHFRLIGTWFDPAFTALAYVFGLIFLVWQQQKFRQSLRLLTALNFGCLLLALLLTYSRSAFLALILVTIIYFSTRLKKQSSKIAKKYIVGAILSLVALSGFIFIALAYKYPSDSTNLFRSNSINARLVMTQFQLNNFDCSTWLIGNGFFSAAYPQTSTNEISLIAKKTTPFPDNFFILLISFFGLPLTIFIVWCLWQQLKEWWLAQSVLFYLSLALLIVAQFNQTVFQPFVILTFGLLLIAIRRNSAV